MAGKPLFLDLSGDYRSFALNNSLNSTFSVAIGISVLFYSKERSKKQ